MISWIIESQFFSTGELKININFIIFLERTEGLECKDHPKVANYLGNLLDLKLWILIKLDDNRNLEISYLSRY